VPKAIITTVVITTTRSEIADTVSQLVNCLNIGQSPFKVDRLTVQPVKPVASAGLAKIPRRETLLSVDTKSKETTEMTKELKTVRRDNNIIPKDADLF